MKRQLWFSAYALLFAAGVGFAATAVADRLDGHDIDVEVISDRAGRLAQYPVDQRGRSHRAYVQAEPGERYAVAVTNRTPYRIGIVVAVDGRNAITGEVSELRRNERMYILGPHQRGEYSGWRTGRDRVNRFFFTDADASYSGAWGDYSAMGVIAVAAFRERGERVDQISPGGDFRRKHDARKGESLRHGAPSLRNKPGTGFGDEHWSPSRQVRFSPRSKPFARHFLKYEWRSTLCELGVTDCHRPHYTEKRNRFWPDAGEHQYDGGFAKYPPRRW